MAIGTQGTAPCPCGGTIKVRKHGLQDVEGQYTKTCKCDDCGALFDVGVVESRNDYTPQ